MLVVCAAANTLSFLVPLCLVPLIDVVVLAALDDVVVLAALDDVVVLAALDDVVVLAALVDLLVSVPWPFSEDVSISSSNWSSLSVLVWRSLA